MFNKNKGNDEEEDYDLPVPTKKAAKLILKNNNTNKTLFSQTTPSEESVSESYSTVYDEDKDSGFLNFGLFVISKTNKNKKKIRDIILL